MHYVDVGLFGLHVTLSL